VRILAHGTAAQNTACGRGPCVAFGSRLLLLAVSLCCTLPGSPRERNACTTSGIPPRAVKVSSTGWGSTSNSNGDSVGEGFGIRRMRAIVRESHTLRVRIPEHACSLVVAAFTPIHGL